jgi:hypothetical protein
MVAAAVIGSAVVGGIMQSDAAGKASSRQVDAANRNMDMSARTDELNRAESQRQFELNQAETRRQYEQNRADILKQQEQNRIDAAPFREAGYEALGQQRAGLQVGGDFNRDFTLADFNKDPGYEFRMQEGSRGLEGSAAARGGLLSGATLKALTQYGQNYASGEFGSAYQRFNSDRDRRFARLSTVAGNGQTVTANVSGMGTAATRDIANLGTAATRDVADMGTDLTRTNNQSRSVATETANQSRITSADAAAAGIMGQANAVSGALTSGVNGYMSLNMLNRMYPSSGGATSFSTMGTPTMTSGNFIPAA